MSYTDHPLPEPLPDRPCWDNDLLPDYVGDGREYYGHNGSCMNCDTDYSESDNSDLSNTHWMHCKKVSAALWERDTPPDVQALARVLNPADPWDETDAALRLLENGWPVMMP